MKLKLLDVIKVKNHMPGKELKQGQVGTILHVFDNGYNGYNGYDAYEIEFMWYDNGQLQSKLCMLSATDIMLYKERK